MMRDRTREIIKISRPNSFSYDHDRALFRVGALEITPEDLPVGFGELAHRTDELSDTELDRLLQETPLAHEVGRPIMLPKLYDWFAANASDKLRIETSQVIEEVYRRLRPDMVISGGRGGFMDFSVMMPQVNRPHPILQTLGNCACLSVTDFGPLGRRVWDEKIASFSYHNVDAREQRVSLLAGLGHIAYQASR